MKKITITILLALFLAAMVSPAMAAINICTVNYGGDCNTAKITVNSGTVTIDLDDVKDFNISVQGYTAATLDINATHFIITRDANVTNTRWDITNSSYNTLGKLLTVLEAREDITIARWDNITEDVNCARLNDVSAQDVNGSTIYTVLDTQANTYTTTNYPKFGALETALEATSNMTVDWSSQIAEQKKARLSTSTLDDQSITSIKATSVTLTAGGTVSEVHSPYVSISGTIADVLFGMQLYEYPKWQIAYSDGSSMTVICGP